METIDFGGKKVPASYIGDGVYAIFDGYGIWLHANDHKDPTDRVYLEPSVFSSLVNFERECKEEEVIKMIKEKNNASTMSGLRHKSRSLPR